MCMTIIRQSMKRSTKPPNLQSVSHILVIYITAEIELLKKICKSFGSHKFFFLIILLWNLFFNNFCLLYSTLFLYFSPTFISFSINNI